MEENKNKYAYCWRHLVAFPDTTTSTVSQNGVVTVLLALAGDCAKPRREQVISIFVASYVLYSLGQPIMPICAMCLICVHKLINKLLLNRSLLVFVRLSLNNFGHVIGKAEIQYNSFFFCQPMCASSLFHFARQGSP